MFSVNTYFGLLKCIIINGVNTDELVVTHRKKRSVAELGWGEVEVDAVVDLRKEGVTFW